MKQQVFFMNFHSAGLLNRISGDEIMLILNYLSPGYFSRGFKHFIKGFIGVKCCWIAFTSPLNIQVNLAASKGWDQCFEVIPPLCVYRCEKYSITFPQPHALFSVLSPAVTAQHRFLVNFYCWLFSFVWEKLLNLFTDLGSSTLHIRISKYAPESFQISCLFTSHSRGCTKGGCSFGVSSSYHFRTEKHKHRRSFCEQWIHTNVANT